MNDISDDRGGDRDKIRELEEHIIALQGLFRGLEIKLSGVKAETNQNTAHIEKIELELDQAGGLFRELGECAVQAAKGL